jgi:hypothetical protein
MSAAAISFVMIIIMSAAAITFVMITIMSATAITFMMIIIMSAAAISFVMIIMYALVFRTTIVDVLVIFRIIARHETMREQVTLQVCGIRVD